MMAGRIRSYSKSFKAQVIQECAKPGALIASVALIHSLNANLIHKWIAQRDLVPEGSAVSKALDYSLKRYAALSRYLNVPIDNN
ncbi:Transposase component [Pseudomonas amygdali pv. tabaci]|uniref:Transposase component n=1 Tax=Pseudomonas amygdali pv. tabaci TaxID=322 RepID=A0AAX1W1N6_PSEAJ|nr:Transposase component [Pseudomonas amygdali pv. tabaci]